MSLYGDLPQAKQAGGSDEEAKPAAAKGWATTNKLTPAFRPKQAGGGGVLALPAAARGGGAGGAAAAAGRAPAPGRGAGRGPAPVTLHVLASAGGGSGGAAGAYVQQQHPQQSSLSFLKALNGEPLQDEYDPSKPNDYEELMKARAARQRAAEEEAERAARMRDAEQELERRRREQAEAAAFVAAAAKPPPGAAPPTAVASSADADAEGGAGAAAGLGPGSSAAAAAAMDEDGGDEYERERQRRLKLSGEQAFLARGRRSDASPAGHPPSTSQPEAAPGAGLPGLAHPGGAPAGAAAAGGGKGMGLAQKLLEKMGWREGQGLGRHRQGMATPLVAQKTAAHAGVIVNAELPPDKRPKLQGAAFNGPPTRVVVLRNMVGPGEVDEDLEEEVGNELTKYGTVDDVMIFEVTTPGYAPEETVRIFIKFDRVEAATRALVDLQGRFFGGRQVRAAFFSEDRFGKQQLAPQAGEFGDS